MTDSSFFRSGRLQFILFHLPLSSFHLSLSHLSFFFNPTLCIFILHQFIPPVPYFLLKLLCCIKEWISLFTRTHNLLDLFHRGSKFFSPHSIRSHLHSLVIFSFISRYSSTHFLILAFFSPPFPSRQLSSASHNSSLLVSLSQYFMTSHKTWKTKRVTHRDKIHTSRNPLCSSLLYLPSPSSLPISLSL